MTPSRRRFLNWLGSASLVGVAARPSMLRADAVRPDGSEPGHAPPIAEAWDMSWTTRVTGKYKAAFDSPEFGYGGAVIRAVAWCGQYKEVYGAERSEMSPVVILRHNGFHLAMNDEYWGIAEVGKELKVRDERGKKWMKTNPVGPRPEGASAGAVKNSIPGFIAAGGIVLVCGWSFGGAVQSIRKAEKLETAAAEARAKAMLLPGVILQPNGIFAALRAQEAGCSYILAS